jgi:hypothetical protein
LLLLFCLCILHLLPTVVARLEVLKDESMEKSANGTLGRLNLMASLKTGLPLSHLLLIVFPKI